jgi:hypothetical protein
MVNELFSDIMKYEAEIETYKTKYDVLKNKFNEVSKELEDTKFKITEQSVINISKDPNIKLLNRMYDDAVSGN